MNEQKYVILNSDNKAINIVLWNGDTAVWQPPSNTTAVLFDQVDPTVFILPEPEPVVEDPLN